MLAVSTQSLHRPMIARPEALARVASPGQVQLQIFNPALILIVEIRPQINHMKLHKYTQILLLSSSVRYLNFSSLLFFSCRCYKTQPITVHGPNRLKNTTLILYVLGLTEYY
jgi:threonine/homoserine efflux transporter RhtA